MQLFWLQGYDATSLQDLLDAMTLSKSSFYQAFASKHTLFTECLERYTQQTIDTWHDRLATSRSGLEFVTRTLADVIDEARRSDPKGCFVVNTASEFAQTDSQIGECVTAGMRSFRSIFRDAVTRGQKDGSVRADRQAGLLVDYLVTTMSGLRTMVKAGTNRATLDRTRKLIVASIT